jgi:hypothetical protein
VALLFLVPRLLLDVPCQLHAALLADHAECQTGLAAELHLRVFTDRLLSVRLRCLQAWEVAQITAPCLASKAVKQDLATVFAVQADPVLPRRPVHGVDDDKVCAAVVRRLLRRGKRTSVEHVLQLCVRSARRS